MTHASFALSLATSTSPTLFESRMKLAADLVGNLPEDQQSFAIDLLRSIRHLKDSL